jgi:outer membrane protein TolC
VTPMRKTDRILSLLVLFVVSAGGPLYAQPFLTLEEAVKTGLEKNLDVTIARAEAEIAAHSKHPGKAGFFPTLNVTAGQSRSATRTILHESGGAAAETGDETIDAAGAGASLNWTVFDGWNRFVAYKKLKQNDAIGQWNLKASMENTVADIVGAYCETVRQDRLLRVLDEAVSISRERLRLADNNLTLGSGSKFDMLRARVDLNADESARLAQTAAIRNAKVNLCRVMGAPLETEFTISDSIPLGPVLDLERLRGDLDGNSASLQIARSRRVLAGLDVRSAASRWYPKLGLNAQYNASQNKPKDGLYSLEEYSGWNAGATLSFNLFNGFSDWIDMQNAKLSVRISEVELENLRRVLETGLVTRHNLYLQSLELMRMEEENLAVARQALDIARERLRVGSYTPLEMREAQNAYIAAENRLVNARFDVKSSENELLRLTGGYIKDIR